MALWLCLVILGLSTVRLSAREITVTGEGNNSLEYYLCTPGALESNTVLTLSHGEHIMTGNGSCIIHNMSNLTLRGQNNRAKIMCSDADRLFVFVNATNLLLEGLKVSHCGGIIPESLARYVNISATVSVGQYQRAVFLFSMVSQLTLYQLSLRNNVGYGIIGVQLEGDTDIEELVIANSNYASDMHCKEAPLDLAVRDFKCSGTGLLLLFVDDSHDTMPLYNGAIVHIHNSSFYSNTFSVPVELQNDFSQSTRFRSDTNNIEVLGGTALTIYAGQKNVSILVTNSNFSNNTGGFFGATSIVTFNNIKNTEIVIRDSNIENNQGFYGGGLSMLVLFLKSSEVPEKVIVVDNTSIRANSAQEGGGCYLFVNSQLEVRSVFFLNNVLLENNGAARGYAMFAENTPQFNIPTQSTQVVLKDILVTRNFATYGLNLFNIPSHNAACYFRRINNVTIMGTSQWLFNFDGGLALIESNLFIRENVTFSVNDAEFGGAINLRDGYLFIYDNSVINFHDNWGLRQGGAIYATRTSNAYYLESGFQGLCVIQIVGSENTTSIDSLNIQISLSYIDTEEWYSGVHPRLGKAIFATPIYNCRYIQLNKGIDNYELYKTLFNFTDSLSQGYDAEVSSSPSTLTICSSTEDLRVILGQTLTLDVMPVDQVNNSVEAEIHTMLPDGYADFILGSGSETQSASDSGCSPVDIQLFSGYYLQNDWTNLSIYLYPSGAQNRVEVKISVGKCPPGFPYRKVDLDTTSYFTCTCNQKLLDSLDGVECLENRYSLTNPGKNWLARTRNLAGEPIVGWSYICPAGYCNSTVQYVDLSVDDAICTNHRHGILCGRCEPGYSSVFGSAECIMCSNWYLLTLLVYVLAGLVLVVLVFALNLTVTRGTINGLIFYVNITGINAMTLLNDKPTFPGIFISLLNLDLGFPLCLYDGMDEFVENLLQFTFPIYLYALCGLIVLLSIWSLRIAKLTSSRGLAVLNTLFYLSVIKLVRASFDCLLFQEAYESTSMFENGAYNTTTVSRFVWFYDGTIPYFGSIHIILVLLAIVFLISVLCCFIVPLLFIKQCLRISWCNARFKPFFDSFVAPYKDKYRFWFGLRVVLSITVFLARLLIPSPYSITTQIMIIGGLAVVEGFIKPYRSKLNGILDLCFIGNFLMLLLWALHLEATSNNREVLDIVVHVFVSIAFAMFCCIIVYHLLETLYEHNARVRACFRTIKQKILKKPAKTIQAREMWSTVEIINRPRTAVSQTEVVNPNYRSRKFSATARESFPNLREPLVD